MVGGNVFGERHRRAPPLQRRRSARPRGTSMGQMGGATRSDDGGRQLGVRAETKGPRGTTTSTGRVGDGVEATRGYQAVAGLTFATKTSGTAVSVPWSTKSVSSTRTSVRTGHVQCGLQRSASALPRTSRRSIAGRRQCDEDLQQPAPVPALDQYADRRAEEPVDQVGPHHLRREIRRRDADSVVDGVITRLRRWTGRPWGFLRRKLPEEIGDGRAGLQVLVGEDKHFQQVWDEDALSVSTVADVATDGSSTRRGGRHAVVRVGQDGCITIPLRNNSATEQFRYV